MAEELRVRLGSLVFASVDSQHPVWISQFLLTFSCIGVTEDDEVTSPSPPSPAPLPHIEVLALEWHPNLLGSFLTYRRMPPRGASDAVGPENLNF